MQKRIILFPFVVSMFFISSIILAQPNTLYDTFDNYNVNSWIEGICCGGSIQAINGDLVLYAGTTAGGGVQVESQLFTTNNDTFVLEGRWRSTDEDGGLFMLADRPDNTWRGVGFRTITNVSGTEPRGFLTVIVDEELIGTSVDIVLPDIDVTEFHNYRVEYSLTQARFFVDGNMVHETTTGIPQMSEFRIWMSGENRTTPPELDSEMIVQYVSLYRATGCRIDTPSVINENESFTATVLCGAQTDAVYGFEFAHSVDPSSPVIVPQSTQYTPGDIFEGKSSYTLLNDLTDGYAVTLLAPELPTPISATASLGSIIYDTDLPGTVTLSLDSLILGNITAEPISTTVFSPTTIEIIDLPLAAVSGTATRETGADTGADITLTIDGITPISSTVTGGVLYFEYDETVPLDGELDVNAPGHLQCIEVLDLEDEVLNSLSPITLLAGDVNDDGVIDITDAVIIVSERNGDPIPDGSTPDLNEDTLINILDLIHVGRNYGKSTGVVTCQ